MRHFLHSSRRLGAVVLTLLPLLLTVRSAAAGPVVHVGPFRSLTVTNGGQVVVRHGSFQRVTLLEGSDEYTSITVEGGDLVIDRGRKDCPRAYKLLIEVVTPDLDGIAVSNGGTVQSLGAFPAQDELRLEVRHGGTIDLRSMPALVVAANVKQGGRIFTKPQSTLAASVSHGGVISYWGKPRVTSAVEDGGVVEHGKAADADRPLSEFGPGISELPPLPPVPVIPPVDGRAH